MRSIKITEEEAIKEVEDRINSEAEEEEEVFIKIRKRESFSKVVPDI